MSEINVDLNAVLLRQRQRLADALYEVDVWKTAYEELQTELEKLRADQ